MGVIYYYKRKNKEAIDIYDRILNIDPKDEGALYKRGLAEFNELKYDEAIKDLSLAFEFDPQNRSGAGAEGYFIHAD
jgi:tetratricopeptide (TPR) repeat protein